MEQEPSEGHHEMCWHSWKGCKGKMWHHGCGGALYGLGFLGSLFYYVTTATSLLGGLIGVVKAILWPAFLAYGVLKFIGA